MCLCSSSTLLLGRHKGLALKAEDAINKSWSRRNRFLCAFALRNCSAWTICIRSVARRRGTSAAQTFETLETNSILLNCNVEQRTHLSNGQTPSNIIIVRLMLNRPIAASEASLVSQAWVSTNATIESGRIPQDLQPAGLNSLNRDPCKEPVGR